MRNSLPAKIYYLSDYLKRATAKAERILTNAIADAERLNQIFPETHIPMCRCALPEEELDEVPRDRE